MEGRPLRQHEALALHVRRRSSLARARAQRRRLSDHRRTPTTSTSSIRSRSIIRASPRTASSST
jgi:hypothetical protein